MKVMTLKANTIYVNGDWSNEFLDVAIIALPKTKTTQRNATTTQQLV